MKGVQLWNPTRPAALELNPRQCSDEVSAKHNFLLGVNAKDVRSAGVGRLVNRPKTVGLGPGASIQNVYASRSIQLAATEAGRPNEIQKRCRIYFSPILCT
jgi:hypothetical protein